MSAHNSNRYGSNQSTAPPETIPSDMKGVHHGMGSGKLETGSCAMAERFWLSHWHDMINSHRQQCTTHTEETQRTGGTGRSKITHTFIFPSSGLITASPHQPAVLACLQCPMSVQSTVRSVGSDAGGLGWAELRLGWVGSGWGWILALNTNAVERLACVTCERAYAR